MREAAEQYRIIAAGAGWIRRRDRGRLRFDGRDRASFLHGLLTNDVQALGSGQGAYAAYLTPQGRMLTDLRIHHCGEYMLAQVPAALAGGLAARFDQLIFTEDVRVADGTGQIAQISVIGEGAAALLARAFALQAHEPEQLAALPALGLVVTGETIVARSDELDIPAFDVFVKAESSDAAVLRLEAMGAIDVSNELFEALRIEAGRPAYGIDMTEDTIPLEAGLLERAISTTKGCYVGQEIIIRVLHRGGGRVAKRLVKLRFAPDVSAASLAGTALVRDGHDVGRVTSAALSPRTGHVVGLGYVHRDHAEAGVEVSIAPEAPGQVAEIVGLAG